MRCGSPLEYLDHAIDLTCSICDNIENGHVRCPNNHYICERCHNKQSINFIKEVCFSTDSINALEIAEKMMSSPHLPMLGCQHAYVAAGAIMTAIRNEGTFKSTDDHIEESFKRTERQAIGGYCGLTGVCGIVPAIGSCVAILLNSTCGTDKEQRLTMEVVSKVVNAITDLTGPSCCKAYVRVSLEIVTQFLKENFNIDLSSPSDPIHCQHTDRHPHGCRETKCPYF